MSLTGWQAVISKAGTKPGPKYHIACDEWPVIFIVIHSLALKVCQFHLLIYREPRSTDFKLLQICHFIILLQSGIADSNEAWPTWQVTRQPLHLVWQISHTAGKRGGFLYFQQWWTVPKHTYRFTTQLPIKALSRGTQCRSNEKKM